MFPQLLDRSPLRIEAQSMTLAPPDECMFSARQVWRVLRAFGGTRTTSSGAELAAFLRTERCWIDGILPAEPLRPEAMPPLLF
jgi:hypothetical protein